MVEVNFCDLCKSKDVSKLYHIDRCSPEFDVAKCNKCGLIFQRPRFSDEEIQSFYSEDYYKGKADYKYIDERENIKGSAYVWKKRLKKILKNLKHKDGKNLKILDIGCSFGGFINEAKKMDFDVYGLDVSEYSVNYARNELGLNNVKAGELSKGMYDENFFDVITMVEVIEHVKNPREILTEIYRILKPGGIVLLQTANMDGKQAKVAGKDYHYFLPGHLFYFSVNTLTNYLKTIGFSKSKVFHGVDFGLLPKLKKSRLTFKHWHEYRKWVRISFYHLLSQIHVKDFAMTSSMVIYGFK